MNYTYAQMKQMQEQAFERVKQMQKQADMTAKQAMSDFSAPAQEESAQPAASRQQENNVRIPDPVKRISMPVEFAKTQQEQVKSKAPPLSLENLFGSSGDKESALLVTLMMLLNAENADKELLFALLYILNG